MSRDLKEKLETMNWSDMSRWVSWILACGVCVLGTVFAIYIAYFGAWEISANPDDWGVFGDFIGGTANPILSFLTIVLLSITIILQAKQLTISSNELRLSREELQLTRSELERSASAQVLSEKALRAQAAASEATAQLATINALMEYYGSEIIKIKKGAYREGDPRQIELVKLTRRHNVLKRRLEQFYIDLTGVDNE